MNRYTFRGSDFFVSWERNDLDYKYLIEKATKPIYSKNSPENFLYRNSGLTG